MQENIKGIRFCHTLKTGGQETYPFYSNSLFETNLTEAEYSSHPSPLVSPSAIPSTVPLRCALCAGKTYRYGTVRYRRRLSAGECRSEWISGREASRGTGIRIPLTGRGEHLR